MVEDNIVNQRLFQIILKNMGIKVEVASNGLEALAMLDVESYDMVMMDCHMPEMDGFAATEAYRKKEAAEKPLKKIANNSCNCKCHAW